MKKMRKLRWNLKGKTEENKEEEEEEEEEEEYQEEENKDFEDSAIGGTKEEKHSELQEMAFFVS